MLMGHAQGVKAKGLDGKDGVMRRIFLGVLALVSAMGSGVSAKEGATVQEGVALTVYNQDLVLVRDRRRTRVQEGIHTLRFEEIAATLDPTSVNVASLSNPGGFKVLEQNYDYDLVNQAKLLQRYIGQDITVLNFGAFGNQKGEDLKVRLLSSDGNQLVTQKSDGTLLTLTASQSLLFPKLPEGLLLRPTLTWKVRAASTGDQLLNVAYLASGMGWHADYTFSLDEEEAQADVNGWVTLQNETGTTFADARLKLLAGEVNRVAAASPRPMMMKAARGMAVMEDAAPAFEEKSFSEYHLYTLQRVTTLRDKETKQIELLSASRVPVQKVYRYDGAGLSWWGGEGISDPAYGASSGNTKVDVVLELNNSEKSGLGMPLPAGKIRVYKRDADGSQEFLGEDAIGHTPKDETVKVKMGTAFDVKGERRQTDFTSAKNSAEESFEIVLKNHKKQDVMVRVLERLYRYSNWKVLESSHPYEKRDSRTLEFPVKVPADGKTVVTYKVRYSWK